MKKIDNRSSNHESNYISDWANASEKIDDIDVAAINSFVKIGIPQNLNKARANASAKKNDCPDKKAF